jgi:serine/threonine protein kinase
VPVHQEFPIALGAGARLGPYEILSPLGAGGMGEVYRARDTKLGRDVAVKVLPATLATNPDRRERFRREARAVAVLNHPHVVTIYSVEEADGLHFLTMELVDGQSLDQSIPESGLPLDRILAIATALADALAAAHEKGIVHRDLKPANVMVTRDGRVKVLDFGLAKEMPTTAAGDGVTLTSAGRTAVGVVMGTPAYMSPEQIAARAVDHRTDLFSLGIILYEMVSGRRPFKGGSSAELASAILRDTPRPVSEVRAEVPPGLARIIRRCLEKDPALRIQTARDVANELREMAPQLSRSGPAAVTEHVSHGSSASSGDLRGTSGFGGRPAIAVLPFENLSRDPEQEYFADGLAEDLITRLSLWRSFPVIARNSSFVYKGKPVGPKHVAADLGVRYVVQGSVRKAGSRIRTAARLADATTGQQIWAQTYDRDLSDVFAVQDEISEAIATSLVGDLQRAEHERAQHQAPENLEAWELYQRALPLLHRFTREENAQARALLERSVALAPRFSTALARLAEAGIWEIMHEWTATPERTLATAVDQARCAVTLDALDAYAHAMLAFALMTAGDRYGALDEAGCAVELNPSMPFALAIHAYLRYLTGHPADESIASMQRAMRLSPHDPIEWMFHDILSGAYLNAGRYAEGLNEGRRLITLAPQYYWGYLWSAMNAVGLGRLDEARGLIGEARRVKPGVSIELARKCLGVMSEDVDRRFSQALRQAGLE